MSLGVIEAETIRRVVHAREGLDLIDGAKTHIGLRHVGSEGSLLDEGLGPQQPYTRFPLWA